MELGLKEVGESVAEGEGERERGREREREIERERLWGVIKSRGVGVRRCTLTPTI